MRKGLKIVLCVVFSVWIMGVQVAAAIADPLLPNWETVSSANCSIIFSDTSGTVRCTVYGKSGTTKIEGNLVLYEDGVEIDEWSISTTTARVTILDSFTGESGATYTLELDVYVTRNGIVERVQKDAIEYCP